MLGIERYLYENASVGAIDPTGRFVGIGRDFGMEIFDRHERKRVWVAWMFGGGRLPEIAPGGEFVVLLRDADVVRKAPHEIDIAAPCFASPAEGFEARFDGEDLGLSADASVCWAVRYIHERTFLEVLAFDATTLELLARLEVYDGETTSGEVRLSPGRQGSEVVLCCNLGDSHAGTHFLRLEAGEIRRDVRPLHYEALVALGFSSDGTTFLARDYYDQILAWSWPSLEPADIVPVELWREYTTESIRFFNDRFYAYVADNDSRPVGIAEVPLGQSSAERVWRLPIDLEWQDPSWFGGPVLWARPSRSRRGYVMGVSAAALPDGVAPGELAESVDEDEVWRLYALYRDDEQRYRYEIESMTPGYLDRIIAVREAMAGRVGAQMKKLGVDEDDIFVAAERLLSEGPSVVEAFASEPHIDRVDTRLLDDSAFFVMCDAAYTMGEDDAHAAADMLGDVESSP